MGDLTQSFVAKALELFPPTPEQKGATFCGRAGFRQAFPVVIP